MSVKILSVQTFSARTDTPVVAVTTSGNTDPFSTGTTNVDATGGTIVTSGTYKIHTFTSSGSFVPSVAGTIEILLVGGGGGGSSLWRSTGYQSCGGSGGAGIVYYGAETGAGVFTRNGTSITVAAGVNYAVTVGGGGAGGSAVTSSVTTWNVGSNGSSSTFIGGAISLSATGGIAAPDGGGSGPGSGGASGTGFSGGYTGMNQSGGGGGGAGQVGGTQSQGPIRAAIGGHGVPFAISGTTQFYGGGGGGGCYYSAGTAFGGEGGAGGGGAGKINTRGIGTAGTANTGGGAGGSCYGGGSLYTTYSAGAAGGSGIVIIRYVNA